MTVLNFRCPKCDSRFDVPLDAGGRPIQCPDCGIESVIPRTLKPSHSVTQPLSLDEGNGPEDDPIAARRAQLRNRARFRSAVIILTALILTTAATGVAVYFMAKSKKHLGEVAKSAEKAQVEVAKVDRPKPPVQLLPDRTPVLPPQKPTPKPAIVEEEEDPKIPPRRNPPKAMFPVPPALGGDVDLRPVPPPPEPPPAKPIPKGPFVSDRPAKEVFQGYFLKPMHGFKVYVSRTAYDQSDEAEGEPLKLIETDLSRVVDVLDPDTVKILQKVPVWIEWDHAILGWNKEDRHAIGAYYYSGVTNRLLAEGTDPRKAGCVSVVSLKLAYKLKNDGRTQNTLLHEFAHFIHDQVWKANNPFIIAAYDQAIARNLYGQIRFDNGKFGKAYASQSPQEYFAELTCAYLDKLDYEPVNRKELKEYDSVGYEIMTKAWGTPEQIAERKKKALEKKSPKK